MTFFNQNSVVLFVFHLVSLKDLISAPHSIHSLASIVSSVRICSLHRSVDYYLKMFPLLYIKYIFETCLKKNTILTSLLYSYYYCYCSFYFLLESSLNYY